MTPVDASKVHTSWMHEHEIVVVGVERATRLLMSTHTKGDVDAVISIADPYNGKRPPKEGFYSVPHRLVLTFDDVLRDDVGGDVAPSPVHVNQILEFGRKVKDKIRPGKRLVIHCHAGISRSTAAALIILADRLGPGEEKKAVRAMLAVSETDRPCPNETMVRYADNLLARNGSLSEAASKIWTSSPSGIIIPGDDE